MSQAAQEALGPWLASATQSAVLQWKEDVMEIFINPQNFFPDIVWEIEGTEEMIWGHTAILYARALAEPGINSQLLLNLSAGAVGSIQRWQSSPPSNLSRVIVSARYTPLIQEIREIYSGATTLVNGDNHLDNSFQWRIENLRKEVVFMWTNRQHTDMRITMPVNEPGDNSSQKLLDEISCHRCILSARSPFFHEVLSKIPNSEEISTVSLPFPLFTSASLHFILGYIYTGTTKFTHRDYDLPTAFAIYRGAEYLSLPYLQELILAEITVEKLHGLFHATLSQDDYQEIIGGTWSTMVRSGCCCWRCMHLVPLTLQFALENDIQNDILERGARRALIALFGDGWCTPEFAALPSDITDSILASFQKMIVPTNALPLLFAAENALLKLNVSPEAWKTSIEKLTTAARDSIDLVICGSSQACFESVAWENIITNESQDVKLLQLDWIMGAISRAATVMQAPSAYQSFLHALNRYTQHGFLDLPIRNEIGRVQNQLLKKIMRDSAASSHGSIVQESSLAENKNPKSRVASPTHFARPTLRQALIEGSPKATSNSNSYTASLDLTDSPQYSSASSRTQSTDYGIYYRRMAPYGRSTGTPARSWESYRS